MIAKTIKDEFKSNQSNPLKALSWSLVEKIKPVKTGGKGHSTTTSCLEKQKGHGNIILANHNLVQKPH